MIDRVSASWKGGFRKLEAREQELWRLLTSRYCWAPLVMPYSVIIDVGTGFGAGCS